MPRTYRGGVTHDDLVGGVLTQVLAPPPPGHRSVRHRVAGRSAIGSPAGPPPLEWIRRSA
ncbi:hypothetical protein [Ornithinimicrobium murale]|uniref:hypothetical protein n=1 Tax=Ornithinimicrobium murale TaxID=1050153 RepID=UPI0013B3CF79|nr:hypothetical protein [Ornithinimicrobium murale]